MRLSFGEGFVDISMYVALAGTSKNTACMNSDNLRRIFRKIRLANFWQLCRLPIGLGSLWRARGAGFPFFAAECLASKAGFWPLRLNKPTLPPGQLQAYSGPFLAGCRRQADKSGKRPASLATHRAGRAYYIYVARQYAKQGIFGRQPKGGFGRLITFVSGWARPKQEHATEKWGRLRHSG
jgi:hypothetical protein